LTRDFHREVTQVVVMRLENQAMDERDLAAERERLVSEMGVIGCLIGCLYATPPTIGAKTHASTASASTKS
jgi:hypothetical protein